LCAENYWILARAIACKSSLVDAAETKFGVVVLEAAVKREVDLALA
jgi:hypothetical protein